MAVSAEEVQVSIIKEVTYGTTPATPVFLILPLTGEGVVAEVTSQTSNMMTEDRQVQDLITTSISASGDLNTELAITPALLLLLESAMADTKEAVTPTTPGNPATDEMIIGKETVSYTLEKRFPDPATPGSYCYHRVTGCVTNTASMTVSPEEPATMSFGIIGKEMETSETVIAGATYEAASNPIVLRGPDTVTLDIENHSVAVNCFGAFGWDLNNNYRGILCLGYLGNKEVAIGRAEVTVNMTAYFACNELLDTLLTQAETAINFEMKTAAGIDPGSFFGSYFPRVKLTQDNIVAGGTGEDVVDDLAAQALYNSAGATEQDKSSMRLELGAGDLTA